jgi:hypothetical protein
MANCRTIRWPQLREQEQARLRYMLLSKGVWVSVVGVIREDAFTQ